ncbi:cathepsin L1-like [Acipenser oxyrinchus oxyrinchus]|uniref:Cystein proteinase inhibitor protein salarin n=1 Tax=Acipenser oxyrinchus oxyrinchus TaxID=40147 RepID=A0AAD8CD99_ACIOX|nr:cathepsin L1-like [Acipenser oxyrinchus oxyrinchus]
MQVFVVFLVAVVTAVSAASSFSKDPALEDPWQEWKGLHGKQYSEETESYRRMVWEDNWRFIEQHNQEHAAGKHSYKLGMNHFGDLTDQEFNKMNGFRPDPALRKLPVFNSTGSTVRPKSIDWRGKGYVTRVKNQGTCGSCWAFSATGALEGQYFKKTGRLVSLSEQNLVDCTEEYKYRNCGCHGGFVNIAFQYVIDHGITSEQSYPYTEKDDKPCRYTEQLKVTSISGFKRTDYKDEKNLRDAVGTVGPISVSVDASTFKLYKSGIYFNKTCTQSVNHAVLAVGYGKEGNDTFWILKNSWGLDWGERGYMRLAKDKDNHCGIANQAIYPII